MYRIGYNSNVTDSIQQVGVLFMLVAAAFTIRLYFAATFGVSGLTKIDSPGYFARVLRAQRILPMLSISVFSRIFPWIELLISFLIITNIASVVTAYGVVILVSLFLGVKVHLFLNKRGIGCGCYGKASDQMVDTSSVIVAVLHEVLASCYVWLTSHTPELPLFFRISSTLIFGAVVAFLGWNVWDRRRVRSQLRRITAVSDEAITVIVYD